MRILKKQLKQGVVQVAVDTPDDLWYLYTIIDAGDVCTGKSEYKYKPDGSDKAVRKKVWVALEVDKTEFRQETGQLRIGGNVVDGSEEVPRSSHHSLDITEGTELTIKKQWMDYHLDKLKESQNVNLRTLLVLFDRENALFALLRPNGYEKLSELKGNVPKKAFDEGKMSSFYAKITKQIEEYIKRHDIHRAVAASPAFWKTYLEKELSKDLKKKVVFATISSVDETAISELLKRPELKQALAGERAAKEVEMIDKAMEALAKDKLVYGLEDLKVLVAEGNLTELLVTEEKIMKAREDETFKEIEQLMRAASDVGAKVHILSTGEKIDGIGGIAAVKRW